MTRAAFAAAAVAILVIVCAAPAAAQSKLAQQKRSGERSRFEASIGALWIGGAGLGSADANLRANNVTPTPFRLFSTETDAAGAPGLDARVAYWLARAFAIEAGFVRVRPELRTRVTADAEGAPAVTVAERIDQYFVDVGVVWLLERFAVGGLVPFVSGGAGYLRQLHEGRTFVETGQVYEFGGGVRRDLFADIGWLDRVGVKLHGRAYVLVDGVQLEDRARTHGAFSGAVFVAF